MANDEEIPLSLPDTQNADDICLTQSQDLPSSQPKPVVWGRLWPKRSPLKTVEMTKSEYTLGRATSCDIFLTDNNFPSKWVTRISKVQFRIIKEHISPDSNDTIICLIDLSRNGTFVNRQLVGKGNKIVLESNDEISIADAKISVYVFVSNVPSETNNLPPELRSKYAVSRKLGSGACGEVKLVLLKMGCQRFAMKTIVKMGIPVNGQNNVNDPGKIMNEVQILKALKHPFVIQMEEIVDTPRAVYIVLELMEGGELFDRIKSRGGLSEKSAKLIFYQVVLAVNYLHSRGITHRDLKPENILLASHSDVTLAKVSDFGLSKLVDAQTMMKTFCGTPMYVAPEILATVGRGSYTSQVDVWSLGVILYASLSGLAPFSCNNKNMSLEEQIKRGHYSFSPAKFENVSENAINLIKRMMTVNPKRRITINQVLLHPWLQDRELQETVDTLISEEKNEVRLPLSTVQDNQYRSETYQAFVKRARLELKS